MDDELNGEYWEDEIVDDLDPLKEHSLVVYSRDWTIGTIYNQIQQGNIDLNPKFQRRNAWNDEKRSKLIESLILGLPVPEIVLAEDPKKKKSFIVIDGKQRLLTIAGFIDPLKVPYWNNPKLSKLKSRLDLNNLTYKDFENNFRYENDNREFINADLRCTVISNYKNTDVLYDIFYRLNTGSVPLSTQELRQVLNKGKFADYLIEITQEFMPLHRVMGISGPDTRLRDIEIILKLVSLYFFGNIYRGNLKLFLDQSMEKITAEWAEYKGLLDKVFADFNISINKLIDVFGVENVGRKFSKDRYEKKFNRSVFEVQVYYFLYIEDNLLTTENKAKIKSGFESLCDNYKFRDSIESTTKTIDKYLTRFLMFMDFLNVTLDINIQKSPITD